MSLERLAALDAKPTLKSVHPLGIGYPGGQSPPSGCGASFDERGPDLLGQGISKSVHNVLRSEGEGESQVSGQARRPQFPSLFNKEETNSEICLPLSPESWWHCSKF